MKVLVINHYSANKGDRAILYFIVRELIRHNVQGITVSTQDSKFWRNGLNLDGKKIKFVSWGQLKPTPNNNQSLNSLATRAANKFRREYAFPIIKYLIRKKIMLTTPFFSTSDFAKALKQADLVIGTGGHHIQTRFTSESISSLTYDMALVLLYNKPLILWSQSIGPLNFKDKNNMEFIRNVIDTAQTIYLRENISINELKKIGAKLNNIQETYDSVIGLNDEISEFKAIKERDNILGLSVYTAEPRSSEAYHHYIKSLAGFVDFAADAGYRIKFFPMEMRGSVADDRPCINALLNTVKRRDACIIQEVDLDTTTHLREVAKCRIFVGHKTHSQIFALTVGTPLIALAYHEKTIDFMSQYNLQSNCITDSELSTECLIAHFQNICQLLEETALHQYQLSYKYGEHVRKSFAAALNRFEDIK